MDNQKIMKVLLSEKNELSNLINRIETEEIIDSESWKVMNEIGDEASEGQELLSRKEKLDNLGLMMRRVDQAIEDLQNNRYGICNRCEQEISEDRLVAHPHAQYCFECQNFVDNQKD